MSVKLVCIVLIIYSPDDIFTHAPAALIIVKGRPNRKSTTALLKNKLHTQQFLFCFVVVAVSFLFVLFLFSFFVFCLFVAMVVAFPPFLEFLSCSLKIAV